MKNKLLIALILLTSIAFGQDKVKKIEKVKFKTSAVCGECKERIEDNLNYSKGIVFAELDEDTKVLTVKYKTKVLNPEKIKYMVSKIGYDAGETPRNKAAFDKLPKCCKSKGLCER